MTFEMTREKAILIVSGLLIAMQHEEGASELRKIYGPILFEIGKSFNLRLTADLLEDVNAVMAWCQSVLAQE